MFYKFQLPREPYQRCPLTVYPHHRKLPYFTSSDLIVGNSTPSPNPLQIIDVCKSWVKLIDFIIYIYKIVHLFCLRKITPKYIGIPS